MLINWKMFYKKRWKRIAPPYIVFVLFWCAVAWLCDMIGVQRFVMHNDNIWCVIENIFLLNGLFANGNNDVVPGGWYIGATVLLYILTPVILKILKQIQRNDTMFIFMPVWSYALLAEIYFCSSKINEVLFHNFFSLSFLAQMPCYVLGMWLILAFRNGFKPSKLNFHFMICMIVVSVIDSYRNISVFKISEYLWAITFVAIFLFFETSDFENSKMVALLKSIGTISYEFYFVHVIYVYIGFVLFKHVLEKIGLNVEGLLAWLICSTVGFVLTYFTSMFISSVRHIILKQRKDVVK